MTIDLMKLVQPAAPRGDDPSAAPPSAPGGTTGASLVGEFQKILGEKMNSLVEVTSASDRLDRDFAAGLTDNIHEVMIASTKANLAIETAVQVRNMALRMYQTLTQIR